MCISRLHNTTSQMIASNYCKWKCKIMQLDVPESVKREATIGMKMHKNGYKGGTQPGFNRAEQLINNKSIDVSDLYQIKNFLSRHMVTSFPNYV